MEYLELFIVFVQVGLLSIGGGYAAIPIIRQLVVTQYAWLTEAEFMNLVTIAEMTPGPITLNAATFVGQHMAGLGGAIVATLSSILPSIILVSILTFVYLKFHNLKVLQGVLKQLRPVIIGLILSAFASMFIKAIWGGTWQEISLAKTNIVAIVVFAFSLFVLRFKYTRVSPILILILSGAVGAAMYAFGVA